MSLQAVLAPVFVLVALTFILLFVTGSRRVGAVRAGRAKVSDVALGESNWPVEATQASNSFNNQFQLPVLFYVLVAFAIISRKADLAFVGMSWLFVATRIIHAAIHVTTNRVGQRFMAYTIGTVVLILMWLIFAARILFAF